jgi:hypothetical protein
MNLDNNLYFGDELISLNDQKINEINTIQINKIIVMKIKRLPYARLVILTDINKHIEKENNNQNNKLYNEILQNKFGITLKKNTSKIEKIHENGLFYKKLKYDANKAEYEILSNFSKSNVNRYRLTKWVITEINGEMINYYTSSEKVSLNKISIY